MSFIRGFPVGWIAFHLVEHVSPSDYGMVAWLGVHANPRGAPPQMAEPERLMASAVEGLWCGPGG